MASREVQHDPEKGKAPEGTSFDQSLLSKPPAPEQSHLKTIPLTEEDHETGKIMADTFGQRLNSQDRGTLQKMVEAGMSGDFSKLGRLANPQNENAGKAFQKMMDMLGYNVYFDQSKTSGAQFDSAQIVEKGAATGLRLKHYESSGQHFYRSDATINRDGKVDFTTDSATLQNLQSRLSKRIKESVDRD